MAYLIIVVENNLASSRHTTTTFEITSTWVTTTVAISIITLCLVLYPISIIGSLSHEVKDVTFVLVVSN